MSCPAISYLLLLLLLLFRLPSSASLPPLFLQVLLSSPPPPPLISLPSSSLSPGPSVLSSLPLQSSSFFYSLKDFSSVSISIIDCISDPTDCSNGCCCCCHTALLCHWLSEDGLVATRRPLPSAFL